MANSKPANKEKIMANSNNLAVQGSEPSENESDVSAALGASRPQRLAPIDSVSAAPHGGVDAGQYQGSELDRAYAQGDSMGRGMINPVLSAVKAGIQDGVAAEVESSRQEINNFRDEIFARLFPTREGV